MKVFETLVAARFAHSNNSHPIPHDSLHSSLLRSSQFRGGILANKSTKADDSLPVGYVFVVDTATERAFNKNLTFGVKKFHEDDYDGIKPGHFGYMYNYERYALSGPYKCTTKIKSNLMKPTGVFKKLPLQLRVEMIGAPPAPELELRNALTYMNQGAALVQGEAQLKKIKRGMIGEGAHQKLHDMLVEFGRVEGR
jgi:hypothetical protein